MIIFSSILKYHNIFLINFLNSHCWYSCFCGTLNSIKAKWVNKYARCCPAHTSKVVETSLNYWGWNIPLYVIQQMFLNILFVCLFVIHNNKHVCIRHFWKEWIYTKIWRPSWFLLRVNFNKYIVIIKSLYYLCLFLFSFRFLWQRLLGKHMGDINK